VTRGGGSEVSSGPEEWAGGTAFPPRLRYRRTHARARARADTIPLYALLSAPRRRHRPMSEREHACARPRPSARDYSNTTYTPRAPPPVATGPSPARRGSPSPPESLCFCHHFGPPPPPPGDTLHHRTAGLRIPLCSPYNICIYVCM